MLNCRGFGWNLIFLLSVGTELKGFWVQFHFPIGTKLMVFWVQFDFSISTGLMGFWVHFQFCFKGETDGVLECNLILLRELN